jgi:hypothetical protein
MRPAEIAPIARPRPERHQVPPARGRAISRDGRMAL